MNDYKQAYYWIIFLLSLIVILIFFMFAKMTNEGTKCMANPIKYAMRSIGFASGSVNLNISCICNPLNAVGNIIRIVKNGDDVAIYNGYDATPVNLSPAYQK